MSKSIQNKHLLDQAIPVNHTFAALMIKNEQHRKILNRQPLTFNVCGFHVLYFDYKVMSN